MNTKTTPTTETKPRRLNKNGKPRKVRRSKELIEKLAEEAGLSVREFLANERRQDNIDYLKRRREKLRQEKTELKDHSSIIPRFKTIPIPNSPFVKIRALDLQIIKNMGMNYSDGHFTYRPKEL